LELPLDFSRARLATVLTEAGLQAAPLILRRDPGAAFARALADVAGFVEDADARLRAVRSVLRPPVVLGAYAIPVGDPA
jgi:chorismate mutase/prephenate dehydratase